MVDYYYYVANWKDVFSTFIDIVKAYDTIDQHAVGQLLRVYEVVATLL